MSVRAIFWGDRIFRAQLLRVHSIYVLVCIGVPRAAARNDNNIIIIIINFNICIIMRCTSRSFMKINEVQISSRAFCACADRVRSRTHEYSSDESRICIHTLHLIPCGRLARYN